MGQKIAFGVGMLANQMFPAALAVLMAVLVQNLGFLPLAWGIVQFLPRIFDAITDPLMGFISDNTRSKYGRRRQYVFVGALIMGAGFIVMWQLYPENSLQYNFIYFLGVSLIYYLGLTIFSVPFVAMGYEMSEDFHERTQIMAIAQWIGQWAWVIAPWFWVILYDPDWFITPDAGARELAIWVGVVFTIMAMIPAIFVKSKSTVDYDHYKPITWPNMKKSLVDLFKGFINSNKQFKKLCLATFLVFNSFNTIAAFSFFIIVYYLYGGDAGSAGIWPTLFGCIGALATTFIVIPIVAAISKRLGKKKTFILSQSISIIGYVSFWFLFVPGKPWMFLFGLPFFSFGIGGLFTLMMSMTADVCDLEELNSGERREGMLGAIYWWMVKFGLAFAGLASGAIMAIVGFEQGPGNPESAITGMRLFFSGLPILGTLLAIWVMRSYDLDEDRAREIRAELDARRENATL